jgi:hypothetical protein
MPLFNLFDTFKTGNNIKLGDNISLIELSAWHLNGNSVKQVYIDGFIDSKKVMSISNNQIVLEDGVWPKIDTLINQAKFSKQVIIFTDPKQADQCLTAITLFGNKVKDWNIKNSIVDKDPTNMNESEDITSDLNNPDPKIRALASAVVRMEQELQNIDASQVESITNEMWANARNGNFQTVIGYVNRLQTIVNKLPANKAGTLVEEVQKAIKCADRNRDDIFEIKS